MSKFDYKSGNSQGISIHLFGMNPASFKMCFLPLAEGSRIFSSPEKPFDFACYF